MQSIANLMAAFPMPLVGSMMTLVGYELSKPIRRLHGGKSWLAVATAIVLSGNKYGDRIRARQARISFGAYSVGASCPVVVQNRNLYNGRSRSAAKIICLKCNDLVTLNDPFCQCRHGGLFSAFRIRLIFCRSRNAPCMCRTL